MALSNRLVVLVLLLLVLAPRAARAEEPVFTPDVKPLADQLEAFDATYDWEGARSAVLAEPERSVRAVAQFVAASRAWASSRPLDSRVAAFFGNLVARVLRGTPQGTRAARLLEEAELLVEPGFWDSTPLADRPSPPDPEPFLANARALLEPLRPCLGLGNMRLALDLLRVVQGQLHTVAWGGVKLPPEMHQALFDAGYQMLALQVALGVADPSIPQGERLVRQALLYGWPERELAARLTLVEAGRVGHRPEVVEAHLGRAAELARTLRIPAAGFAAATFGFEQDRLKREDLPWAEVVQRHRSCWELLGPGDPGSSPFEPFLWRWVGQAARVWVRDLGELALGDGPRAREAQALVEADLDGVRRLALGEPGKEAYREGLLLQWGNLRLDLVEGARLWGRLDRAEELLASLRRFARLPEGLEEVERQTQPALDELFPDSPRRLADGEARGLVVRYHQEALRLQLARNPERLEASQAAELAGHVQALQEGLEAVGRGETGLLGVVIDLAEAALFLEEHPQPELDELRKALAGAIPDELAGAIPAAERMGDRADLAWLLYEDARFKLRAGDRAGAEEGLRRALGLVEDRLSAASASRSASLRVRHQARPLYELLARVELEAGRTEASLEILGRLQQVQLRGPMEHALSAALPQGRELQKAGQLQARESALEGQQQALFRTGGGEAAARQVRDLLASTRAQYYDVLKRLQLQVPELNRLAVRPLNFARLQPHIPEDAAIVQYFPAPDKLYVFVATRKDLVVRSVALARRDLDALVLEASGNLSFAGLPQVGGGDWRAPQMAPLRAALTGLHRVLVEPLEGDLAGKRVVAFIPTGSLTYVPFAALARDRQDGDVEFLVERFQAVTLLKAVDLDQLVAPPPSRDGGLVALGNPDGTLQAASREVEDLQKLFPQARVALRAEATRARLEDFCQARPSYIHLATHGQFSTNDPLESYLVLADGKLPVSEIVGLHLGEASLVTLSACQTGLGEASSQPGEDVTTLAEAFWYAGGRSLLVSLWSVSDEATRPLVVEFYKALRAGRSKAEALQTAQVSLLRGGEFRSPFYWAPFVLVGDWR